MKHMTRKIKMSVLTMTAITSISLTSCEDFLTRPDETQYTIASFYKTDEQCKAAADILYSVPWFDFFRGWIQIGDVMSGNYYMGSNGFWKMTPKDGTVDAQLADMSASLWAVNARANTLIENINLYSGGSSTETVRNQAKGEALVWKAMAYFYMARIFGPVPIIHDNTKLLASGQYSSLYRATTKNVYDYIILTLEKAIEWLPEEPETGRLGKFSAYGLLAKVYLTASGLDQNGTRDQAMLDKAKEYALLVADHYNYWLEPNYEDVFRGSFNKTPEGLITWRWVQAEGNYWTAQNSLQADFGLGGFDEFGGGWGDWGGPSIDLQTAFGEDALLLSRKSNDKRRKATMMMYGDTYPYFWRDHPTKNDPDGNPVTFPDGFDWAKYSRDVLGDFRSPVGANIVKHLVGDDADHVAEMGAHMVSNQSNGLATHILRLSDVYLVLAEAILGNNSKTSDATAIKAFNTVRVRAGVATKSEITFDDIFNERRLELAFEGDFWYDFVRLSYYNPTLALAKLNAQNRKNYLGLNDYYKDGVEGNYKDDGALKLPRINADEPTGQPYSGNKFQIPFPETDLRMNPNLAKDPVEYDLSQYTYE